MVQDGARTIKKKAYTSNEQIAFSYISARENQQKIWCGRVTRIKQFLNGCLFTNFSTSIQLAMAAAIYKNCSVRSQWVLKINAGGRADEIKAIRQKNQGMSIGVIKAIEVDRSQSKWFVESIKVNRSDCWIDPSRSKLQKNVNLWLALISFDWLRSASIGVLIDTISFD